MNQKFNFVANNQIEPEEILINDQKEYKSVVESLDEHFQLKSKLKNRWLEMLEVANFKLLEEDDKIFIKYIKDNLNLVEIDSKAIGHSIIMLMELAYREGARNIMNLLDSIKYLK